MDAQYGPLSAEFYQLTKPMDADYPDVPYYAEVLAGVKGRILEIGAGTGRLLVPLVQEGLKVEALEPSPYMIAWLEKNLKAARCKAPIHQATAESFRKAGAFEAIIVSFGSFQLFEPFETARACLERFFDSLAKKGQLFIDLDVLRPEPHKAGLLAHGAKVPTPDGASILLTGARKWDFVEQVESVHLRYEKWAGPKLLATEVQDFTLRGYGHREFRALLESVGFRSVEMVADYGHAELSPDTQTLCFRAVK